MKATTIPNDDDRGFISVVIQLFHLALTPPAAGPASAPAEPKPSLLERFDRWAARSRQRQREAYLAGSKDMFELEARMRHAERQPYYGA